MSELQEIARLVKQPVNFQTTIAKLKSRPLRIAFIIRDDISPENFARILEYNSSVWGGIYNCLIPTDGQKLADGWWQNLHFHRSDVIVFCGDKGKPIVTHDLQSQIQNALQPFSIHNWHTWLEQNSIGKRHQNGASDPWIKALPMTQPLRFMVDNRRYPLEPERSNVSVPKINREHPFYGLIAAQIGIAVDDYQSVYEEVFKAQVVHFDSPKFDDYLRNLGRFENRFTPLSGTKLYTKLSYTVTGSDTTDGLKIILVGNNWIYDLCTFWNLRLVEKLWATNDKALLVPASILRSSANVQILASAIQNAGAWNSRKVTLLSQSLTTTALENLRNKLAIKLSNTVTVQISRKLPQVALFHCTSTEATQRVRIEDARFFIEKIIPECGEPNYSGNWAIDVELGYEFPVSSKLNDLLCGSPSSRHLDLVGHWFRYINNKLICRAGKSTRFYEGAIPHAASAFNVFFEDRGYTAGYADKRPYSEGFLGMVGSSKVLEDKAVRILLWSLKKGDSCDFNAVKGHLMRGGMDSSRCLDTIDNFVKRRILLRGMAFKCERCGLSRWYPINTIGEELQCAGCLSIIRPPTNASIKFRLNELVSSAVTQGSIPVLLTEAIFQEHASGKTLSLYGAEIRNLSKGLVTDADLITTCREELILVECKEFKDGALPSDLRKAKKQITALAEIAKDLENCIVALSTLLPLDNPNTALLAQHALRLNKRMKIPVHLICLTEMGFVNLENPNQILEHPNIFHVWK